MEVHRTAVSFKSSNAKFVPLVRQEEGDGQLAVKKRQAEIRKKQEGMDTRTLAEELQNAKLQKEKTTATRIQEKEMEIARAEGSQLSKSLQSVLPVPIQSGPFEKMPS